MSMVFFPNHPSPARRARSRSRMGPVSTYAFPRTGLPDESASHSSSSPRRDTMTSW